MKRTSVFVAIGFLGGSIVGSHIGWCCIDLLSWQR